jgi:hypothetical protein
MIIVSDGLEHLLFDNYNGLVEGQTQIENQ